MTLRFLFWGDILSQSKMKLYMITLVIICIALLLTYFGRSIWKQYYYRIIGRKTVSEVVKAKREEVEKRLIPYFNKAAVKYPPTKIALLAFKQEKIMELWALEKNTGSIFVPMILKLQVVDQVQN